VTTFRRSLPNVLSVVRLGASPLLLVATGVVPTMGLLVALGTTDVLDGWLARRWRVVSAAGARLDSAADTVFFLSLMGALVLSRGAALAPWLVWVLPVLVIRLASGLVSLARHHRWASLHTWANKVSGVLVFAACGLFLLVDDVIVVALALGIATLAALEELALWLAVPNPDLNVAGWWFRNR